jgi:uncharacterized protein (TIGR02466 family)
MILSKPTIHFPIFSSPLFITQLEDLSICEEISKILNDLKPMSGFYSHANQSSWQSDDQLQSDVRFNNITNFFLEQMNSMFDCYSIKRDNIYINNMWGNISDGRTAHGIHIHQNSYFSGILYVNMPKGAGNTRFHCPIMSNALIRPEFNDYNHYNSATYNLTPQTGNVVLFPSWLPHSVTESSYDFEGQRITLAFTCMFRADVSDRTTNIKYI